MWVPDTYEAANTPFVAWISIAPKTAGFLAIFRLYVEGVGEGAVLWVPIVSVLAGVTIVAGNLMAIPQSNIKRLLAYSSIAHAGFIIVGLMAFDRSGVSAVVFYLAAYGFTTIAAFGLIMLVRLDSSEATGLAQWAGLGRRAPVLAGAFAFLLLAFAGIPLTSGFTAKFAVFGAAVAHGGAAGVVLTVIGVLSSAITAYVYFRVIVLMYFSEPIEEGIAVVSPSVLTIAAIAVGVIVTVVLGLYPSPLLELTQGSALFLR